MKSVYEMPSPRNHTRCLSITLSHVSGVVPSGWHGIVYVRVRVGAPRKDSTRGPPLRSPSATRQPVCCLLRQHNITDRLYRSSKCGANSRSMRNAYMRLHVNRNFVANLST